MRRLICVLTVAAMLATGCATSPDSDSDAVGDTGAATTASTSAVTTLPTEAGVGTASDGGDGDAGDDDDAGDGADDGDGAIPTTTSEPFIPETESGRPFLELSFEEKIDAFLDLPNTAFAANLAGEMGLSGEVRWVPWLLDIMRFGGTQNVTASAMRGLQTLTGVESSDEYSTDFVAYGSWSRSRGIDPGEGYRHWKKVLFRYVDAQYPDLLEQVTDDVALGAIQWGGVRRGGIPELNDPARLTPAEAEFMTPEELVLGVVIDGVAVAYPVRFLARHELANDTVGEVPVALGYCTLCLTALMFDRRLSNGDVLTFQTSGLLMDSNKVMIDNETESLWNHLSGTSFAGPLAGTRLEQFPIATIRWEDWLAEHPNTWTLDKPPPTFFAEMPERPPIAYDYTPGAAYRPYYASDELWFPTFETPDDFDLKEEVVTVDRNGHALAMSLAELAQADPFVYVLGGEPLVIVPNSGGARVYSAAGLDGSGIDWLSLPAVAVAPGGVLHDQLVLSSVGADTGLSLELPRIVSSQSFWFAWYGLHPDTLIWPPVEGN